MGKTLDQLYKEIMDNLEKERVVETVMDPYRHLFDLDGATKVFLEQSSSSSEMRAHLEIVDSYNANSGNPNKVEEITKAIVEIVNKYNLSFDEEAAMQLLSRYFITKESLMEAYRIWRKNKPVFEKSKYFVIKSGDCWKPIYEQSLKDAILHKGKSTVKYIVGDEQCLSCGFYDASHKYCTQYNLQRLEMLTDLLKKPEFKLAEKEKKEETIIPEEGFKL